MEFNKFARPVKWGVLIFGSILLLPIWYGIQMSLSYREGVRRWEARDRTLERAFASLRASAKDGKCDEGIWKKAIWAGSAKAESFGVIQPVGIEVKPMLCAALADEKWSRDQLSNHDENGMVGVWQREYPYASFSGAIVMYAKRPASDQPYEVVGWSAYTRLDGVLRPLRKDE